MNFSRHFQGPSTALPSSVAETDETILAARAQAYGYAQIVGPDAYERSVPNLSGFFSQDAALKRHILTTLAQPGVRTPPEEVYLLRDAYVCALPLVYTSEREIFAPSRVDHHTVHPFEYFVELGGGAVPVLDGPAIFIFKAGTANYGHILVEMLPKLENIAPLIDEPTRVLVPPLPGTLAEQLEGVVAELYPNKFVIEIMRSPIVRTHELLYPGPISLHNARKSRTLLRFADRLRGIARPPETLRVSDSIYVSREGTTNRRMLNEPEIRACFEAHGYTAVRPEGMTVLEQAGVFAAAKRVAGPLGAGLTNIVFSPEQADIVMIDAGLQDFFFWDLACLKRQNFSWHFATPPTQFELSRLHTDYEVPVEPVRQMLRTLSDLG